LDGASVPKLFAADDYFQKQQARSVLCLPLIKQGSLRGALYLENNLASHVFTPDRIAVLKVLASQAAISLEIARFKDELYKENIVLRDEVDKTSMFEEVVGRSTVLQAVLARAAKIAAITGATRRRLRRFELAEGGTLLESKIRSLKMNKYRFKEH
jgi:GAF domain-containing protein